MNYRRKEVLFNVSLIGNQHNCNNGPKSPEIQILQSIKRTLISCSKFCICYKIDECLYAHAAEFLRKQI